MVRNRALRRALLWLLAVTLSGGFAVRLLPLQFRAIQDSVRAWRLGMREIRSENGLSGWSRGHGSACVVLVHGIGDSNPTWLRLLAQEGLQSLRVIAWELPGHGGSDRPAPTVEGTAELRPRAMARRLHQATRAAGCSGPAVWVGNSLGGWVSAWVALDYPEAVQGLVLLAPAGLDSQARHPKMPSMAGLLENPTLESIQEFRARAYARQDAHYPTWVWQAALERIRASSIRRVRAAVTPEDALDLHLGKVRAPTVILWGKQDRILPLDASQDFRKLAPSGISSFRELEDCGHLPQKEAPEKVVTAIRDVLAYGSY